MSTPARTLRLRPPARGRAADLWRVLAAPAPALAVAVLAVAFGLGVLLAYSLPLGLALVAALCLAPVALLDLPRGVALLIVIVFVRALPGGSLGVRALFVLLALSWLAALTRGSVVAEAARRHRRLISAVVLLLAWLALSLTWARAPGPALEMLWYWVGAGLVLVVTATSVKRADHLRLVTTAFVAAAVISTLAGFVTSGFSPPPGDSLTAQGGRLQGGQGDPNFLAAALPAAMALACGLMAGTRSAFARLALLAAIPVLALGLATSGSRGGLLAAVITLLAGIGFARRGRGMVAGLALVAIVVGGLWFASQPALWARVTAGSDGGSGRTDLWIVARAMAADHPLSGVGLDNFTVRSQEYVREVGPLDAVRLISEQRQVVHNAYLQMLAEGGAVGLVLMLAVMLACLTATRAAVHRFRRNEERSLEALSVAVLAATLGMLTASLFLSNGQDLRLWLLLGLGPSLLALSQARQAAANRQPRSRRSRRGRPASWRASPTLGTRSRGATSRARAKITTMVAPPAA